MQDVHFTAAACGAREVDIPNRQDRNRTQTAQFSILSIGYSRSRTCKSKRVIIEKQDNRVAETSAKCHWRPKNCLSVQPLFLVGRERWLHAHISCQTTSSTTTTQREKKPSQKTYSGVPGLYRLATTGKSHTTAACQGAVTGVWQAKNGVGPRRTDESLSRNRTTVMSRAVAKTKVAHPLWQSYGKQIHVPQAPPQFAVCATNTIARFFQPDDQRFLLFSCSRSQVCNFVCLLRTTV